MTSMRKQNSPTNTETIWKAPSKDSDAGHDTSKPSIEGSLARIIDLYHNPKVKKQFRGWANTLAFYFPDLDESYMFKINGSESIELSRGDDPSAVVHVTIPSAILVKLLDKEINAIKVYSLGILVVKGEMKHLMKLRKLLF